MIENSKKSKNVRNATPTTSSPLAQNSINLEKDDIVLGDIGKKMKKQDKKKTICNISSHVGSTLKDLKEYKIEM
jgi:hypothetical protein